MQTTINWHRFVSAAEVALSASTRILAAAEHAIAARGEFKLVLAGGSTPEKIYNLLTQAQTDWSKWKIYFGDERCLPADHPDRNSVMAARALLSAVTIPAAHIYPIAAELGPEQGAAQYRDIVAHALPFDMVLLGMGEDGHTASLFPGHEHDQNQLTHAVYNSPKPPPERVSISAKALADTAELMFIITGAGKRDALQAWLNGADLPVATIKPPVVDVYIDNEAYPA
ncbi:MAG: 6-phosphogluconolactonase [Methylobacter sp.]|nr:MAG: 6-phosphogluconolactonase [Methylobacter sp.]